MTQLSEVITWVRRIIKTSSDQSVTDDTIKDYINRFYTFDMPARLQLFELKRQYTFETIENVNQYQFPYDNYQLIEPPVYCDGVQIGFFQSNDQFYKVWPELVLNETPTTGDGSPGAYTVEFGQNPILRGFTDDLDNLLPAVYITATDGSGTQLYIVDDGLGALNQTDATFQNIIIANAGTVDYDSGTAEFTFNANIPDGNSIRTQTTPFSPGVPRVCLFFNNIIKLYPVPDRAYKMQFDCYVTPSAFLETTDALPFAYMAEYLSRGAARKILSDDADYEQFQFYEGLFREQENLVLRRTNRQNSTQRTPTIFAGQSGMNPYLYTNY